MSHSPVIELQALASDPNSDIVAVLMKAKMIAIKLDLKDLVDWIELELNGYPNIASTPDYRSGQGILKAFNPVNGWIPVDLGTSDPKFTKHFTTFALTESVSSMAHSKVKEAGTVSLTVPAPLLRCFYLVSVQDMRFVGSLVLVKFSMLSPPCEIKPLTGRLSWKKRNTRRGINIY